MRLRSWFCDGAVKSVCTIGSWAVHLRFLGSVYNRRGEDDMRRLSVVTTIVIALSAAGGRAQAPSDGPYKVLRTAKVGGPGGFDYVYADVAVLKTL